MRHLKHILGTAVVLLSINVLAVVTVPGLQNNRTRQQANRTQDTVRNASGGAKGGSVVKAQPVIVAEEDTIPDSLLKARRKRLWTTTRSIPISSVQSWAADIFPHP